MKARLLFRRDRLALVPFALALAGCASPLDPTTRPTVATTSAIELGAAGFDSRKVFYPLQLGNRWRHRGEQIVRIIPNDQGDAPVYRSASVTMREMVCIQSFDKVPYVVESETRNTFDRTYQYWTFYRQTSTGLYERDVLGTEPPPCALGPMAGSHPAPTSIDERALEGLVAARPEHEWSAYQVALQRLSERMKVIERIRRAGMHELGPPEGTRPSEMTRLRYPLELKSQWVIRDDPSFQVTARVEGVDFLELPAGTFHGFRIRFESAYLGPGDVVTFWYGRQGYLRSVVRLETDATDEQGNLIGRAVFDERDVLVDLSLASETMSSLKGPLR